MGNLQVEKLLDLLSSKAMANLKLGEFWQKLDTSHAFLFDATAC